MPQKHIFQLRGTTCQSCDVVIEQDLSTLGGVSRISASHAKGLLEIDTESEANAEKLLGRINEKLASHGYAAEVSDAQKSCRPVNGSGFGGALVLLLAVYLIFKQFGLLSLSPSIENTGGLLTIFTIGLVASVSSCTAVVIGLLAAVSSKAVQNRAHLSRKERFSVHIHFTVGRLFGFAVFGALIGLAGSALQLSATMNGLFVLVIALVMVTLGLHLLGILPPHLARLSPPKWLGHRIHALKENKHPAVPFALGALTFFLPCGFTQSMQLYALTLGDPLAAALVMVVFALGTTPALLGVGFLTSASKGPTLAWVTRIAGAGVIVLGVSQIQNALALLGLNLDTPSTSGAPATVALVQDGKQYLQMEISRNLTYEPSVLEVVEGVPVEWQIYGTDQMGCASSLYQRDFGIRVNLQPGMNTVRFTPNKAGKFAFSCSMGMIRGTLIVKPRA